MSKRGKCLNRDSATDFKITEHIWVTFRMTFVLLPWIVEEKGLVQLVLSEGVGSRKLVLLLIFPQTLSLTLNSKLMLYMIIMYACV